MIIALKGNKKKKIGKDFLFEDFLKHIKTLKLKLNYENEKLIKKIKSMYEYFCDGEEYVKSRELLSRIKKYLDIKHNPYSREGLRERGFDDEYINDFYASNGKNHEAGHKKKINEINSTIYHLGKFSFYLNEKPKCKICGSEIEFRLRGKDELEILCCSNKECQSRKTVRDKHIAFLPEDILAQYGKEKREKTWTTVEYWVARGYSENDAKKIISEKQSVVSKQVKNRPKCNKEHISKIYGENTDEFFRKRSIWCVEYWTSRGYSVSDAKKIISKRQTEMAKRNAVKDINERRKGNVKCIEYWLNKGFTKEDAKNKISQMQKTFSLKKCIEKYGKEKGTEVWRKRQIKWQNSLNARGFHQLACSTISQELFKEIEKKYPEDERDFLFYGTKNREYTLKNDEGYYYRYDFCDLNRRKMIEFNGDVFHGNPKIFLPEDKPHPFQDKTAKELWESDEIKKQIAIKNGFTELIIWEKDYREDKEKIINECLNFLNEK